MPLSIVIAVVESYSNPKVLKFTICHTKIVKKLKLKNPGLSMIFEQNLRFFQTILNFRFRGNAFQKI